MKDGLSLVPIRGYEAKEIKDIRNALGMTQAVFATFMGVSKKTVEAWESGRNMPDGPARRLFAIIQAAPDIVVGCSTIEAYDNLQAEVV